MPPGLRWLIRAESPACCECCKKHDGLYYAGGPCEARLLADAQFKDCLIRAGMPKALADLYFVSVRSGGAPWLRIPNVSWGFGGKVFRYSFGWEAA